MFTKIKKNISTYLSRTVKPVLRLLTGPVVIVTVDVLCLTIGPAFIAGAVLGGLVMALGVFTVLCNTPHRTATKVCDFIARRAGLLDLACFAGFFVLGLSLGGVTIALVLSVLALQLSLFFGGVRLSRCLLSDVHMDEARAEMGVA